jgi:lysophospholipase L1-like esterase
MVAMSRVTTLPAPSRRVRIAAVVAYLCLLAVLGEGVARLSYAVHARAKTRRPASMANVSAVRLTAAQVEATGRALGLDPYEMADAARPGRWKLRPGYRATVRQILDAKRRAGRLLAVRYIEDEAPRIGMGLDDISVQIDADGFRGPALDTAHRAYRILTLGDSCTFGSPLSQQHGYPRSLERELRRRGFGVEVVNGGVEGYAPDDVLARIDEFRTLRPEMTTLYIGWNALFTEHYLQDRAGIKRYSYGARLVGRAYEILRARLSNTHAAAVEAYERPKRPERETREVRLAEDYLPSFFPDVVRIVDEMQGAGSRVVLITLPGLYSTDREPSPRALEIGHLPEFTDNPYVLARMAERYNEALGTLARDRGLALVDLGRWARQALQPPEDHFIDSVHLDEPSQERFGKELAIAIAPLLPPSACERPGTEGCR